MSKEPHAGGVIDKAFPYTAKRPVRGRIVCVLDARSEKRGMDVEIHPSRAVPGGEIHELAVTDDPQAGAGTTVDRVAYLGFFEIEIGGVILVGDRVTIAGREIGHVVGFDNTHMPNHMNVLVKVDERHTGAELGLKVEDEVEFALE